jgi:hypothetical protein
MCGLLRTFDIFLELAGLCYPSVDVRSCLARGCPDFVLKVKISSTILLGSHGPVYFGLLACFLDDLYKVRYRCGGNGSGGHMFRLRERPVLDGFEDGFPELLFRDRRRHGSKQRIS